MTDSEFDKHERNKRNKLKQATVDDVRIKITKLEATLPDAEIGIIPLAHGLFAIVDKELFTELDRSIWHLAIQPEYLHARSSFHGHIRTLQNRVVELAMVKRGETKTFNNVSFKNKIPLDCRLSNLIFANERQGVMRNRKGKRNSSSQYKGVRQTPRDKELGNWRTAIYDPDIGNIYLGAYKSELHAAKIYDAATAILFGEDGYRNLREQDIDREHYQEANARIEWFKYRIEKKRRETNG